MDDHALVIAFRDDARAYCDFIDAWRAGRADEPYSNLLRLLSNLASRGVVIPFQMAKKDINAVGGIDHAHWQAIASELANVTSAATKELINKHAQDEESLGRASMFFDDLADIYRDLRDGLDLYALGDPDHVAEAAWQWRFGYEHHWGEHLFRALMTVHEIRFRLLMD